MFSFRIAIATGVVRKANAIHLTDRFCASAPDEEWLPEARKHGWVVITADYGVRKDPVQRKILDGLTVFFIVKSVFRQVLEDQAVWFIRKWPKIKKAARVRRPTHFRVMANGEVRRYDD